MTGDTLCLRQQRLRVLLDGKRINTDLMTFKLSLRGNFDGPDDYYDSKRHELVILIRPDSDF
ncbi:MAG TPA: DNA-binding domain-containing protein [Anaerolineae bacterium]|nr:DNA-binding domain-containing protein [Anaerolineae bacterium]